MINPIITKRIIQLLAQSYALDFQETYNLYLTLNSIDQIIEIVDLTHQNKISLSKALDTWKAQNGQN